MICTHLLASHFGEDRRGLNVLEMGEADTVVAVYKVVIYWHLLSAREAWPIEGALFVENEVETVCSLVAAEERFHLIVKTDFNGDIVLIVHVGGDK